MPFYKNISNSGENVVLLQSRFKTTLFLLVLTGILFLVYANGLKTPFQSDDERHIFPVSYTHLTLPTILLV